MRGDFFHEQAILIHDFGTRGIQANGKIVNREGFVGAKGLLIFKRAAFTHQQIHKSRGLGKQPSAVGAKNVIDDWSIGAEGTRIEESGEVSAVVNMQMRQ